MICNLLANQIYYSSITVPATGSSYASHSLMSGVAWCGSYDEGLHRTSASRLLRSPEVVFLPASLKVGASRLATSSSPAWLNPLP